jgi:TonB family protein
MLLFTQSATPQKALVVPPPAVLESVVPGYPQLPSGSREPGEVRVEVSIDSAGHVTAAKAISGPQRLRAAALFAVRQWLFQTNGRLYKNWIVTFDFILARGIGDPPLISAALKSASRIEIFADYKQSGAVRRLSTEEIDQQVASLIERMLNEKSEQEAFADLEGMGCAAVPAIIKRMDDRRRLPDPTIALMNKAPDAFEAKRFYGPEQVVDALAAILNQVTGHHFGFIYNGATSSERTKTVMGWREFLGRTPASKVCE